MSALIRQWANGLLKRWLSNKIKTMFCLMSRTLDVVYFSERKKGVYDKRLVCLVAIGVYLLTLSLALNVQVYFRST